eukprot:5972555-Pyramimonas_sp.AAC.1
MDRREGLVDAPCPGTCGFALGVHRRLLGDASPILAPCFPPEPISPPPLPLGDPHGSVQLEKCRRGVVEGPSCYVATSDLMAG